MCRMNEIVERPKISWDSMGARDTDVSHAFDTHTATCSVALTIKDRMMARTSLLLCLLATSSYAFAVPQPPTFAARTAALKMAGGDGPPAPPVDLKVRLPRGVDLVMNT